MNDKSPTPNYYQRRIGGVLLDPYRIERAYGGLPAPLFSALKKILAAGQRGAKNAEQDIGEAIDALMRWREMEREDESEPVDASAIFNAPASMEDASGNEVVADADAALYEYMTAGCRARIAELERERGSLQSSLREMTSLRDEWMQGCNRLEDEVERWKTEKNEETERAMRAERERDEARTKLAEMEEYYRPRRQSEEPAPEGRKVLRYEGLGEWRLRWATCLRPGDIWTHQPPAPEAEREGE